MDCDSGRRAERTRSITMRGIADSNPRNAIAVLAITAFCTTVGCSSDPPPPPDLTPALASSAILQRWSMEELNHFRVTFHSDTLIECGVNNGLWKLVEMTDSTGHAWSTTYQLTDKGRQIMTDIDLKESGRGHQITLKGPYRLAITSIGDGAQPTNKRVGMRWEIDWDRASNDLKACLPRFELSGTEMASFELNGQDWRLASFLTPEEAAASQGGAGSVLDKLH